MNRRERFYRRLLGLYPRAFRAVHAEPILGTLLDGVGERGLWAESREVTGLLAGAVRARGEEAARAGRGKWRHGFAALLVPLAVVNLAILGAAFWSVERPRFGLGLQSPGAWWPLALLAAVGLLVSVSLRRRAAALIFALAGLVPLGYDEWLQAGGRGIGDHLSLAHAAGFQGPLMSPFLLFSGGVTLIAVLAWSPEAKVGGLRRAAWLLASALVVSALIPMSLYVLSALGLLGIPICVMAGFLDRRFYGVGLALWLVAIPYIVWWWSMELLEMQLWSTYVVCAYLAFLPVVGFLAMATRRPRRAAG